MNHACDNCIYSIELFLPTYNIETNEFEENQFFESPKHSML